MTTVILIVLVIWVVLLTLRLYFTDLTYKRVRQQANEKDVLSVLEETLKTIEKNNLDVKSLRQQLISFEERNKYSLQTLSVLRFNPYADTGGDQSFMLTILDGNNTGVLLSSLHSRTVTRWYAKEIKEGKGVNHTLSTDEKKAIELSIKRNST